MWSTSLYASGPHRNSGGELPPDWGGKFFPNKIIGLINKKGERVKVIK